MTTIPKGSSGSESKRLAWIIPHTLTDTLHASARVGPARVLQQLGWSVTLIAVDADDHRRIADLQVHYIPAASVKVLRLFFFHLRALLYLARRWQDFDLIFFQQVSGVWLLPLALLRFLHSAKPLLVMDTRDFIDAAHGNKKIWLRRQIERAAYYTMGRWTAGQTAITARMAALADIPAEQLWGVWPSGVQTEIFAPAQQLRCWPTADEPIQLVYVGILLPKRNLMQLCRAVKRANQQGMKFVLSLVGSGRERSTLQAFVEQTAGRIQILDPVPHDQVPTVLAQAHVGVTSLPAPDDVKYEASSPIKLFEYMAAGLPILATTNGCHTDVVKDGQYAFWAQAATEDAILDALRALWARRADLPRLGEEAAKGAAQWSWQAAGYKLNNALERGMTQHNVSAVQDAQIV